MAWVQPDSPNLADFFTYAYAQGIPASSIPLPVLTVTSGGSGYTTAPAVTIAPPDIGTTMMAVATVSGGAVTALTAVYPGSNYASLPVLTIAAPPSGGTQATGVVTALGSIYPVSALNQSVDITINSTGGASIVGEISNYIRAVYNLGVHLLLQFAQDTPPSTFFATQRQTFGLNQFRPGIVMAAGDQSTSQTFILPKFFQEITLEALEATRTPWGRQWLAYEQMYGQTVWGVS